MTSSSLPLTLSNPGDRNQVVSLELAQALTKRWEIELADASTTTNNIEILDLSCRVYPPASAAHICDFLQDKVANLRIALLNDIIASLPTDQGLATLEKINALLKKSPISELNLDDNALGIRGVELLCGILSRPTLQIVSIRNDGLSAESMPIIGAALAMKDPVTGKCALDNLKEVNVYNNMIGVEGAAETGRILVKCASLEKLQYEGCRAGPEGTMALVQGLVEAATVEKFTSMKSLTLELSLGMNDDDPVAVFCQALKTYTKLEHLKLYDCSLEGAGCSMVLQSLKNHTGLVSLNMAQNEMDARTVRKHLVPVVKRNLSTLQVLQLENNEITSVGVEHLCNVMCASPDTVALQELKLTENLIGSRGAKALIAAKESMPNLKILTLDSSGFPDEEEELKECYGDILVDMEELEEDDMDEDLEEEDESEDDESEDDESEDEDDKKDDGGIEDIAFAMGKVKLTPSDVSL
jgi:Ran GTPase-activating protein 1